VVIVEGYMDVIALRAAGVLNAVATMGTAGVEGKLRLATTQA
jgi:DNA primase